MADVILKDRDGNDVEYAGASAVQLVTADGGVQQFVAGEIVEKTINPDFSEGDMEVVAGDGAFLSKVIITRPENLVSENIAKDVEIAGIPGILEAGGDNVDGFLTGSITEIYSEAEIIREDALAELPSLEIVDLPNATQLKKTAHYARKQLFYGTNNLVRVNIPKASCDASHAEQKNNTRLVEFVFPLATKAVAASMFSGCTALKNVDLRSASNSANYAFKNCSELETVRLDAATNILTQCFYGCSKLKQVSLENAVSIADYAFYQCSSLTKLDFPSVTSIADGFTFSNCTNLTAVIFRSTTMVAMTSEYSYYNSFNNTPIKTGGGYIYVPAALVSTYKGNTHWKNWASAFRAIEDYPEICG